MGGAGPKAPCIPSRRAVTFVAVALSSAALVTNGARAHTRSLADKWRDVNQIYGCLMVPVHLAQVGQGTDDEPGETTLAASGSLRASLLHLRDANLRVPRVWTRVAGARSLIHVPHRRHG